MGSLMENLKKKRLFPCKPYKDDLPISDSATKVTSNFIHLRKRIPSFSVAPLTTAFVGANSSAWGFRKSQSMPSLGEFSGGPLRRWWEWSLGWLLARKPAFAKDIEMNEEEISMLGCNSRGSLRHVFYKMRSEFRKLVRSETLPTAHKFGYDSFNYAQNFDDGALHG